MLATQILSANLWMQRQFKNTAAYWVEFSLVDILAGKTTTDDELEEMLESGNPSIFTSDVSAGRLCGLCVCIYTDFFFL